MKQKVKFKLSCPDKNSKTPYAERGSIPIDDTSLTIIVSDVREDLYKLTTTPGKTDLTTLMSSQHSTPAQVEQHTEGGAPHSTGHASAPTRGQPSHSHADCSVHHQLNEVRLTQLQNLQSLTLQTRKPSHQPTTNQNN